MNFRRCDVRRNVHSEPQCPVAPMQTATEPNKFGVGPKIRDPTVKDSLASCTTVDCEQASAFSVACSSTARDGAQDSNSAAPEGSTPAGTSGWAAGCSRKDMAP